MKNKYNILKAVYLPITLVLWAALYGLTASAQSNEKDGQMPPIPAIRQLSHDYIIENEKNLIRYPAFVQNLALQDSIQVVVFENRKIDNQYMDLIIKFIKCLVISEVKASTGMNEAQDVVSAFNEYSRIILKSN